MKTEFFILDKDTLYLYSDFYDGDINEFKNNNCVCIGAIVIEDEKKKKGETAGLICTSIEDDEIIIDWLYVKEKFRNRQLATQLVCRITEIAHNLHGVESVSCITTDQGVGKLLDDLIFEDASDDYSIFYESSVDEMIEIKGGDTHGIYSLHDLSEGQFIDLNRFFKKNDSVRCLVPLPIEAKDYLGESVVVFKDDKVTPMAMVLLNAEKDTINVSYVFIKENSSVAGIQAISKAKQQLINTYGSGKKMTVTSVNETSKNLIEKIFHNKTKTPILKKVLYV